MGNATNSSNVSPHTDIQNIAINPANPQQLDDTHDDTVENTNFLDIPPHLLTSFRIIYTLKLKLNTLQTKLENLKEHRNLKTLPPGLRIHHKSKFYLSKELSERWENTLTDASLTLLDITIDHYKQDIQDTQHKLQHRTEHLRMKCDQDTDYWRKQTNYS